MKYVPLYPPLPLYFPFLFLLRVLILFVQYAAAIKKCDPNGPLIAFISKMFPVPNTKAFYAFGRVFSGTLRYGQKVYAIGTFTTGSKKVSHFPSFLSSFSSIYFNINKLL
jgi:hypothetical protein